MPGVAGLQTPGRRVHRQTAEGVCDVARRAGLGAQQRDDLGLQCGARRTGDPRELRQAALYDQLELDLQQLGEGGHAIVWRARDRLMRTMVAVKILRALDPDWQRRFALEAEVMANLHHVNVVRAIARGRTPEGQPYVVLELVVGQSLRTRLDAGGPLPWREVIEIGIQVAAALTALHSRGVIHRDVKPGNLMRTIDDGGGLVIKLIDCGGARLNSDWDELPGATPKTPRRRTDAGMAIGTPAYMPMEAGLVPPNERFDVYSLGVTLYELCTGALPGIDPVQPLGEVNPVCDAPADLAVVLAAALALEPGDRTQTAAELGRALAAVRAAHPEQRPSSLFDGRYERLAVMGTMPMTKGQDAPVSPRVYARACPDDLAFAILSALNPDPKERPSAAELVTRLEDVLAGDEDLPATPLAVASDPPAPFAPPAAQEPLAGTTRVLDEVHGGDCGSHQRRAGTVLRGARPRPMGMRRSCHSTRATSSSERRPSSRTSPRPSCRPYLPPSCRPYPRPSCRPLTHPGEPVLLALRHCCCLPPCSSSGRQVAQATGPRPGPRPRHGPARRPNRRSSQSPPPPHHRHRPRRPAPKPVPHCLPRSFRP